VSVEGHAYIKDTGVVKNYDAEDFFIRRLQVSPPGVDVKGAHDSMSYSSPAVGNESYVKVNVQADWQGDLSVNVNVSVNLQVWDGDKIDVERTDYHNVPMDGVLTITGAYVESGELIYEEATVDYTLRNLRQP
jgi:hypothetical protein